MYAGILFDPWVKPVMGGIFLEFGIPAEGWTVTIIAMPLGKMNSAAIRNLSGAMSG